MTACGPSEGDVQGATQEPNASQESSQEPAASQPESSKENVNYLVFKPDLTDPASENIKVECDSAYTLRKEGEEFYVLKDRKDILYGSFSVAYEWSATRTTNDERIKWIEKTDEYYLYWMGNNKICRLAKVSESYPYLSGKTDNGFTENDILEAMNNVHFSVTDEDPS